MSHTKRHPSINLRNPAQILVMHEVEFLAHSCLLGYNRHRTLGRGAREPFQQRPAWARRNIMLKKNAKGFTLIELMIVVAIIGILAAVAIPGFMKYIKDSKTTEAKTNIKAVAEGALSFYQTEHPTGNAGTSFFTKQYPSGTYCRTVNGAGLNCGAGTAETPALQAVGAKSTGTFNAEPWVSLNFTTTSPVYYSYSYAGRAGTATVGSAFGAIARAKLDKANAVDSCFQITGNVDAAGDPTISAIIDLSEAATPCVAAVAPAAAGGE